MQTSRLLVLLAALLACGSEAAPKAASPDEIEQGLLDGRLPEGRLADRGRADRGSGERSRADRNGERKARQRRAENEVSAAESMLPEGCGEETGEACMPPDQWVARLCNGVH